jgi:hypothetical protein
MGQLEPVGAHRRLRSTLGHIQLSIVSVFSVGEADIVCSRDPLEAELEGSLERKLEGLLEAELGALVLTCTVTR